MAFGVEILELSSVCVRVFLMGVVGIALDAPFDVAAWVTASFEESGSDRSVVELATAV